VAAAQIASFRTLVADYTECVRALKFCVPLFVLSEDLAQAMPMLMEDD
jgi:hypothetical protein